MAWLCDLYSSRDRPRKRPGDKWLWLQECAGLMHDELEGIVNTFLS